MSRISKKHKIIIIVIILVIPIIPYFLFLNYCPSSTKISYAGFNFDKNRGKLYLYDSILWDTGLTGSVIYEECKGKVPNRVRVSSSIFIDVFNKKRIVPLCYSKQFNFGDSLSIHNFFFCILKNKMETENHNEIGAIGMSVIGKANWLIDFNLGKVETFSKDKTEPKDEQAHLIFKYEETYRPKICLDFSVCQIEDVLIDAGSNCEITLFKSDIEQINKKHKPLDTLQVQSYGFHSTEPVIQNLYVYDTLTINNICFQNVQIIEGNSQRLIGFKFFKRFDKVFLDTKENRFYFYSANTDL